MKVRTSVAAVFHWKDRETFAAILLERFERQGFARNEGLSERQLRELVRQVSEHVDECLEPGAEFSLNFDRNSPWLGQYEFGLLEIRRERKGFDTLKSTGNEIDSFVVDVRRRPEAMERRQHIDSLAEGTCDRCGAFFAQWRCRHCNTKWLCQSCAEAHECN